jgi:hypothetical protein
MTKAEELGNALVSLINKTSLRLANFTGVIVSVDMETLTCDVQPDSGGAIYHRVRLKPVMDDKLDGLITIPAIGSHVIVARLRDPNDCFIFRVGEIEKHVIKTTNGTVELNGDQYSLVKAEVLKEELAKTNQVLAALLSVINSVPPIIEGGVGAPSTLQAAFKAALTGKQLGDYSKIDNDMVKHG